MKDNFMKYDEIYVIYILCSCHEQFALQLLIFIEFLEITSKVTFSPFKGLCDSSLIYYYNECPIAVRT